MYNPSALIDQGFRSALSLLLKASQYALDSRADRWQFAVEMSELTSRGATLTDIRWLILRGFGEHGKETTVPGDDERSFRVLSPTAFPLDTCVVLTVEGVSVLSRSLAAATELARSEEAPPLRGSIGSASSPSIPDWDATRRELRYRGHVVKRYRVPAKNQSLVLTAFQEEGWPGFIDDPLRPANEQDSKHRLQVTIKSLNRNQLAPLIKFHGNGSGLQIYWEAIEST
jgi:hypothetical protein